MITILKVCLIIGFIVALYVIIEMIKNKQLWKQVKLN